MMSGLQPLKDRYKGKTVSIVGGGPSLRYLDETFLGHNAIIAINQAVYKLQEMDLHGQIYSLQQDGCANRGTPDHECLMPAIRKDVILLLSTEHWQSRYCFPDHQNTYFVDWNKELGIGTGAMSLRAAVKLAQWFGAKNIQVLCCDAFEGNVQSYNVAADKVGEFVTNQESYANGARQARRDMGNTPYQVIVPKEGQVGNSGIFRVEALRRSFIELRDRFHLKNFIETGTLNAETAKWASRHFEHVWTIDIWEPFYQKAVRLNRENVMPLLGDSRKMLPRVLDELHEPALLWLDAHWNGTKGRGFDCPILEELREIKRHKEKHIVMIDDASLFDYWQEWPDFELVKAEIQDFYDYEIRDDAIVCIPKETMQ